MNQTTTRLSVTAETAVIDRSLSLASTPLGQERLHISSSPSKSAALVSLATYGAQKLEEELLEEYYAENGAKITAANKQRSARVRGNRNRAAGLGAED